MRISFHSPYSSPIVIIRIQLNQDHDVDVFANYSVAVHTTLLCKQLIHTLSLLAVATNAHPHSFIARSYSLRDIGHLITPHPSADISTAPSLCSQFA